MKDIVYGEGLNFNVPWFERPYVYDIRTRPCNLQTLSGSKDLQMVTIGVRVLHKPDPNKLVWIYQHLGKNYDERILPSLMNECAKAVVARYNANELLTKRDLVSADIKAELVRRAGLFNVKLEDVAITHLSFSPEYARAVERKQVAQQDAERAKYIVIGAQQEKQTIITKDREAKIILLVKVIQAYMEVVYGRIDDVRGLHHIDLDLLRNNLRVMSMVLKATTWVEKSIGTPHDGRKGSSSNV